MIKNAFFILMLECVSMHVLCQAHLSVDLDDPVYSVLEIAEIKGAIAMLPHAKPYTKSSVIGMLEAALTNGDNLLPSEISLIEAQIARFEGSERPGFTPELSSSGNLGNIVAGLNEESELSLDFNAPSGWNMYNAIRFFLKGDIADFVSYYGCFGATFDKVGPDAFQPYSFTKKWDGFHIGFGEPRYSISGIEPVPYFSFLLEDETTARLFEGSLILSFSRFRRDWGDGEGNLYLAGSARPYQGFDLHARLASWCNLSWSTGSLNDWMRENELISGTGSVSYQKMFTIQMLEFFPFDWLYLSSAATAVWGKRFEPSYLAPLLYPVIAQNTIGNLDNVSQSVNASFLIPGYTKLYFSFYADEMELSNPGEFFSNPRNMVAYQVGAKAHVPFIPATLITLQYTKVEPFVYAHYPESAIQPLGHPTDMSYTNDGENLGFHTPPNSDELLIKAQSLAVPNMLFSLAYRLIRHGTSGGDPLTDQLIYGDVDAWFDYLKADLYPDKSFLQDGIYDWNNIVALNASFMLPRLGLVIGLGYTFAYTFWVPNSSGVSAPQDSVRNIVSISVKYSR